MIRRIAMAVVLLALPAIPAGSAAPERAGRSAAPPAARRPDPPDQPARASRAAFRRGLKASMAQLRRDLADWRSRLGQATPEERRTLEASIAAGEVEWRRLRLAERRARRPGRLAPPPVHQRPGRP